MRSRPFRPADTSDSNSSSSDSDSRAADLSGSWVRFPLVPLSSDRLFDFRLIPIRRQPHLGLFEIFVISI